MLAARCCNSVRAQTADIRRLLADSSTDEAQIKDRLKQLQEIESRGQAEARKAYDAIDQVLDLRQQAQFRIFEEQMDGARSNSSLALGRPIARTVRNVRAIASPDRRKFGVVQFRQDTSASKFMYRQNLHRAFQGIS